MTTQDRYLETLKANADQPVIFQSDVGTMFVLVSHLQLALRHPTVQSAPTGSTNLVKKFIDDFRDQLAEREPLLAELVEMGNKPGYDS